MERSPVMRAHNQVRDEPTSDDLTRANVATIARIEERAESARGRADHVADWITRTAGSMSFVYFHILWFGGWIILNSMPMFAHWRIDPFPFTFLTFVVSLEAIFLSTFILITQDHQQRLADRRNRLDLQVNLLAEQENTKTIEMLEAIQTRLGISTPDPEVRALKRHTQLEALSKRLDESDREAKGAG